MMGHREQENAERQLRLYTQGHLSVLRAIRSLLLGMSAMAAMIRCSCDEE